MPFTAGDVVAIEDSGWSPYLCGPASRLRRDVAPKFNGMDAEMTDHWPQQGSLFWTREGDDPGQAGVSWRSASTWRTPAASSAEPSGGQAARWKSSEARWTGGRQEARRAWRVSFPRLPRADRGAGERAGAGIDLAKAAVRPLFGGAAAPARLMPEQDRDGKDARGSRKDSLDVSVTTR